MRRFLLPVALGIVVAAVLPVPVAQGQPPPPWCLISNIPCVGDAAGLNLSQYIYLYFINFLRYAVVAVAFGMFVYYAFALLFAGDDESATTKLKTSFGHMIFGCAIVSLATFAADTILPTQGAGAVLLAPNIAAYGLTSFILFFKLITGVAVSFHVTYQGLRLIALQGKEDEVSRQKKKFFHGLIGVAIVLLMNAIIAAASPGSNAGILSVQLQGIANFLLSLFGLLAVVAFIASAAMVLLSVDESNKEKGKKGMFGSVVVLIIVFSAFAIIQYVLSI